MGVNLMRCTMYKSKRLNFQTLFCRHFGIDAEKKMSSTDEKQQRKLKEKTIFFAAAAAAVAVYSEI